jgi:hypothetical protein
MPNSPNSGWKPFFFRVVADEVLAAEELKKTPKHTKGLRIQLNGKTLYFNLKDDKDSPRILARLKPKKPALDLHSILLLQ